MLRLTDRDGGAFLARNGVTTSGHKQRLHPLQPVADRPFVDYDQLPAADDVVLNARLVDWAALSSRVVSPDVVSVLIPTHHDWEMTELAVQRVVEHRDARIRVEVVVVDNGCPVVTSAVLSSLPERYDDVKLVRSPVNRGFALGNNLGLVAASGATVVFLNNDTEVQAGWLDPLLGALEDPDVLGAQSLLVYPSGSVQSAGVVFPRGGGIPHVLLQGFPTEDAEGLEHEHLHALTGAALAMRHSDVLDVRGFDPVFRNGMEDVDICLRLAEKRAGHFVVRPDSRVIHHESRSPGRFSQALVNRQVLLDRWAGRLPEDDVTAWRHRGFEVIGHEIQHAVSRDQRLCAPQPVLSHIRVVREGQPSLRWAIKNPAPFGPTTEMWGDTHFARQLAAALRDLGQEVVIDHRGEFERRSGWHDDVVVLLRGTAPYTPLLDRVNLLWLISHPELVTPSEPMGWDRVYVASVPHAKHLASCGPRGGAAAPGQHTGSFHPDRAEPDTGHRWSSWATAASRTPLVAAAQRPTCPSACSGTSGRGASTRSSSAVATSRTPSSVPPIAEPGSC